MNEEFETIGLGKARMQLTELAKYKSNRTDAGLKYKVVEELYVEIRAARMSGIAWARIRKALVNNVKDFGISTIKLAKIFHDIDVKYEKETGEPALTVKTQYHSRKGDQK